MSAIQDLNAVSGWRLFLYALLGTWVIGKTGTAVAEIVHGPTDYGAMLAKAMQPDAPAKSAAPAKVAGVDVAGIPSEDIDSLAANLAANYGPLPPEAIPNGDGTINVGSALPWLAGIVAAAAGVAWLVHNRTGAAPVVTVKPSGPVKIEPVLPSIPGLMTPGKQGQSPAPTQEVQQVADLLKTVIQQGQQVAQGAKV